jgi:hypothetical protein
VQLRQYVNIQTSASSSLLVMQHYMLRPTWPTSGGQDVALKEPTALLSRCSAFNFDVQ